MTKYKEEDLAHLVVEWLRDMHWEVYQEVQLYRGMPIADIVAVRKPLVWIVECKLSLGLPVMAQAHYWSRYAHYRSVATPKVSRNRRDWEFKTDILKSFGIGLLIVGTDSLYESIPPRLDRKVAAGLLLEKLNEKHKYFAPAGNANGLRWTPFTETKRNVIQYVERNPGATLKEMVDGIEHHYHSSATARSALAKWVQTGVIKGIKMVWGGDRKWHLYPDEEIDN